MMNTPDDHALDDFLRARRQRPDPVTSGSPAGRRRTPGLRREEVAQLASISPTWYVWLEQGRDGAPLHEVLKRIACGPRLTTLEYEHSSTLTSNRPPQVRLTVTDDMTLRLQRVFDASTIPAIARIASWDVIVWNTAAARVLTDYSQLPSVKRDVPRRLFIRSEACYMLEDWRMVGQPIINAFRADITRMGMTTETGQLIVELTQQNVEFARFWQSRDVAGHGKSYKRIHHPQMGPPDLKFTSFAVEDHPDLSLLVFNPAMTENQRKIRGLFAGVGSSPGMR